MHIQEGNPYGIDLGWSSLIVDGRVNNIGAVATV